MGKSLALFLTVFIHLVGFGIIVPLLPYYAQTYGASGVQVGLLLASFSAMQFLFSADREHYATGRALQIRYAIAHAGVVVAAALVQMPFAGRAGARRAP